MSPNSLTFAKQTVGTTSATKNVTQKNNLLTDLAISRLVFTGTDPGVHRVVDRMRFQPALEVELYDQRNVHASKPLARARQRRSRVIRKSRC